MLEQKLQEELNRFKAINKYAKKMIMEQDAPAAPPAEDPAAGMPPADPAAPGADAGMPPADPAAPGPDAAGGAPDTAGMPPAGGAPEPPAGEGTEEIDVTDLVDLTKSIKSDLDNHKTNQDASVAKMDDLFTKLGELEQKLAIMDQLVGKIDELGNKVEEMKPETPQEKLEMRSLDSYPFNEKPQEFFAHKQAEMQQSGKNEYVLTKNDVTNYPQDIKNTFNPNDQEEDEYKF
jgi:hypothetical protein